jgi:hypothetical protein
MRISQGILEVLPGVSICDFILHDGNPWSASTALRGRYEFTRQASQVGIYRYPMRGFRPIAGDRQPKVRPNSRAVEQQF